MKAESLSHLQGWKEMVLHGQPLTFRRGQVLCYEGHAPYGLFVIRSGEIKFLQTRHSCEGGHLRPSREGKILGLDYLLSGTPFCCTCMAATDCEVVFISKTQLAPYLPRCADSRVQGRSSG